MLQIIKSSSAIIFKFTDHSPLCISVLLKFAVVTQENHMQMFIRTVFNYKFLQKQSSNSVPTTCWSVC